MQLERLNSNLLVKLLTGVIYYDEPLWQELINNKSLIMEYFSPLGLELSLHESDGFAYLSQISGDYVEESINRLVKRHPLSFEVSLLLIILREELEAFDSRGTDETELYLTNIEIKELIEVYFKDKSDEVRLLRELDRYINAVVKLGFLKQINNGREIVYKVMTILKAKINPDFLEEFKGR
ncbi:MAG: hypothetical protein B6229_10780, partial [Spirochaetaceae bacterium 4572_7]